MVAGGVHSIQGPIDQVRGIQHRPDHVIEMANDGLPTVEMRIFKNGRDVVEVEVADEDSGKDDQSNRADHDCPCIWTDLRIHGRGYTALRQEGIGGTMTISRTAVWVLLLGLLLLWFPSGTEAQVSKKCREAVDNLFKKAADLSIKDNVINGELTSLSVQCRVQESDSILRLPRYRDGIKMEKQEDDSSNGRLEKTANWYNQAASYDPGGIPTRSGPSAN